MTMATTPLPIDEVLPELLRALRGSGHAVLTAEPGAGKTTRVPLALLDEQWLDGGKIIMLEPRRLAARSAAEFMAKQLGERVGETVGYRVRLDTRVGPNTIIEVVTEGILTRMLQEDPALTGVAAVLFDEFHERHLHGDLGLALALQCRSLLREDLRLVVMSATLDAAAAAELMGNAPVIASKGLVFPVETRYRPSGLSARLEDIMAEAIRAAMTEHEGDVLAFLPGTAEICRTARRLAESGLPGSVHIRELHGMLPLDKQAEAVAPASAGERKVVLATSIAESSLTVEGVRIVVDSGLMRVSRFSARTGMSRLETVPVSKASADQRRGRAGRLAPGFCFRLWSEGEHAALPAFGNPEIAESDLTALRLELAVWGVADYRELSWLTPPPEHAYQAATELLHALGCLNPAGQATPEGKTVAALGLHPRFGAMLLRAGESGQVEAACRLAALLSERDILPGERSVSVEARLALLKANAHDPAARRIMAQADRWKSMFQREWKGNRTEGATPTVGGLLAHAFPDRIAQRRSDGRYLLAGGRGAAALGDGQPLSQAPYLVVAELDDAGAEGRIFLGEALTMEELQRELGRYLKVEETLEWDNDAKAIRGRRRLRLGSLILKESPLQGELDPEQTAIIWSQVIAENGLDYLPWSKTATALLGRMRAMQAAGNLDWPDVSEDALLQGVKDWLQPHLAGIRNWNEFQRLDMAGLLAGMLSWKQRSELDEQVPSHWTVPSGSRIPVDYSDPAQPFAAVRLQELFGLKETPRLAGGRLPLTLHLLSPAQRPVQVTRDLESFWRDGYFEVKKDLKGRYPKHYWPDNPYEAIPTNRAKPRTVPKSKG